MKRQELIDLIAYKAYKTIREYEEINNEKYPINLMCRLNGEIVNGLSGEYQKKIFSFNWEKFDHDCYKKMLWNLTNM